MPGNLSIKIEGLNEFHKALKQYPKIAAKELDDAIKLSLGQIHREAVPRTPYQTGRLRSSYQFNYKPLAGELYPLTEYAYVQHEGFFRHPKGGERKYLENATKASLRSIERFFEKALENIVNTIVRKAK